MNKLGEGDTIAFPILIYIILNIFFFGLILTFVYRSSSGEVVYEQSYAKEIALTIDNAQSGMSISLPIQNGIDFAKKNNQPLTNIFKFDNVNKKITVSLSTKGGYSANYFSNYNVSYEINGGYLILKIQNGK